MVELRSSRTAVGSTCVAGVASRPPLWTESIPCRCEPRPRATPSKPATKRCLSWTLESKRHLVIADTAQVCGAEGGDMGDDTQGSGPLFAPSRVGIDGGALEHGE